MRVHRVETGQGDELVQVAHRPQLPLELRDRRTVQVRRPVERGRAVVGQQLARELGVDRLGEPPRFVQVGVSGLAPHQIRPRRVRQPARDRLVESRPHPEEALGRALAGHELVVPLVHVVRQQAGGVRVGARDEQGRNAGDVRRQARRDQLVDRLAGRREDLAPHVPALLERRQLILEVHAGGTRLDHRAHQLESVQHAAEAGFRVGHDRREPVARGPAVVQVVHLVGPPERRVDAGHQLRRGVGRVQALVGVGLASRVHVTGHLPAADVDRLEARLHHLHGLRAGQRAQRAHAFAGGQQVPQGLRAPPGQRVLRDQRAPQPHHLRRVVAALDPPPARVLAPAPLQLGHRLRPGRGLHRSRVARARLRSVAVAHVSSSYPRRVMKSASIPPVTISSMISRAFR